MSRKEQKGIRQADITLFLRQLATMLSAGVPLVQSLQFVAEGVEGIKMASLITMIQKDVTNGSALSKALKRFPHYFNDLMCSLIKVGETSGTLDTILQQLASYLERVASLKARVKKALYYPITVVAVMIGVSIILLGFVVPNFATMFQAAGKKLPAPTQIVMSLSDALINYWWLGLLILFILVLLHFILREKARGYLIFLDQLAISFPLFGMIIKKAIVARIARTLSICIAAGVPLGTALEDTANAANNRIFCKALNEIKERIIIGDKMVDTFRETNLFDTFVIQMIAVGEHAGSLETMLAKVADYYDEQVANLVDGLSSLIEPIIIVMMGIIVGGFVVAMYLPIFRIGELV